MKLAFSSLFLIVFSFQMVQSQVIEPTAEKSKQELYDFYTLKQKKNKTAAWIMLGGGLVMTMTGLVVNSVDEAATAATLGLIEFEKEHKGDWMIYLGGATTIASIPFFISAGKNKTKAELHLKNSISIIKLNQNGNLNYLSVSLSIPF